MVLYQRIHRSAIRGEVGNHVGLADDDLSIQDVIVGIVASVDDKGEVHDHSCGIPMAVGAGIRLVGRYAVVGQKLSVAHAVDDDAPAGAFHVGRNVDPAADEVQLLVLQGVGVNRDGRWQDGSVGVLGYGRATMEEGQKPY